MAAAVLLCAVLQYITLCERLGHDRVRAIRRGGRDGGWGWGGNVTVSWAVGRLGGGKRKRKRAIKEMHILAHRPRAIL
jgi:hypothetical protein